MDKQDTQARQSKVRHRVWSETATHEQLRHPGTIALVQRFELQLLLAVQPGGERETALTIRAYSDRGLDLVLWPMLSDREGRWVNVRSARPFRAWVERLIVALDREGIIPPEVVFDMEPAIQSYARWMGGGSSPKLPPRGRMAIRRPVGDATEELKALSRFLQTRGIQRSCAFVPLLLLDNGASEPWESHLGTPLGSLEWDHASAMVYSSILRGLSRRVLRRRDVEGLLGESCRLAKARFGDVAGVSVGVVGPGAFGNEPAYATPADLAVDVGIAKACGIETISLFDLGGVIRRRPEAWLEALVGAQVAREVPALTLRSRMAIKAARSVGLVRLGSFVSARSEVFLPKPRRPGLR